MNDSFDSKGNLKKSHNLTEYGYCYNCKNCKIKLKNFTCNKMPGKKESIISNRIDGLKHCSNFDPLPDKEFVNFQEAYSFGK